jgi:hypothetical protein
MPLGRAVASAADLVEDDAKEACGGMGRGAGATVGSPESREVESSDGRIEGPCEVVSGEALFDVELVGVVVVPGRSAKAWGEDVRLVVGG